MPSRLDDLAAVDFARGMPEMMQTIIRRIGGSESRTESVEAIVSFDQNDIAKIATAAGITVDGERGRYSEARGLIEIAADQEAKSVDTWVIDGAVYKQVGSEVGGDGGSKTIVIGQRIGKVARQPKTR